VCYRQNAVERPDRHIDDSFRCGRARVGVFERGASNFEDLCLAAGAQFRDEVGLRLNQDAGLRALAWIIGADFDEIALIFPKNAATRRIS
jgi:hypothetical protein